MLDKSYHSQYFWSLWTLVIFFWDSSELILQFFFFLQIFAFKNRRILDSESED